MAALQVHRGIGQGLGTVGARYQEHGAASRDLCRRIWYGKSRCCRAGHVSHERCRAAAIAQPPVPTAAGPGVARLGAA